MLKRQILALLVCVNSIMPTATHTISTSLAANMLAKVRYTARCIRNAWYSLFSYPDLFVDKEKALQDYIVLNDDPLAKPIIENILKQYDADAMGITVYENKHILKNKISMVDMHGSTNDIMRVIILQGYTLSEAIRDKSHPYYPCAEGILAHEIGHIVDHATAKLNIFKVAYFAIVTMSVFQAFKLTGNIMMSASAALGITALDYYYLNALITKLYHSYHRYCERVADYHVIEHAKDSRVLWQMAQYFRQQDINPLLDPVHPSCAERTAYLEKAAQELEAKIARENKS